MAKRQTRLTATQLLNFREKFPETPATLVWRSGRASQIRVSALKDSVLLYVDMLGRSCQIPVSDIREIILEHSASS